jgi:molecular chaperone GrpE
MTRKIAVEHVEIKKEKRTSKDKKENTASLKKELRKKNMEIRYLKKETETLKEEFLRHMADKENLRKRMEREKQDYYQYALSEFLKEILSVLDNFERALNSEDIKDSQSIREGIEMISKQLKNLLVKQGITPIQIKEKRFNPHLHQAFITEESRDVDEPEVAEELQKGYMLHDRLLRPSLVKVIVPKKED